MSAVPSSVQPPSAKQVPFERTHHGDTVSDPYAWLADPKDPETIAYLEEENAYLSAMTGGLSDLRTAIFGEIKARTQETDLSVPVRKGGWWLYARTVEGQQYAIHCRRRVLQARRALGQPGRTAARLLHRLRRRRTVHTPDQGPDIGAGAAGRDPGNVLRVRLVAGRERVVLRHGRRRVAAVPGVAAHGRHPGVRRRGGLRGGRRAVLGWHRGQSRRAVHLPSFGQQAHQRVAAARRHRAGGLVR